MRLDEKTNETLVLCSALPHVYEQLGYREEFQYKLSRFSSKTKSLQGFDAVNNSFLSGPEEPNSSFLSNAISSKEF